MTNVITAEAETVSEEPIPANSRKRQVTAAVAAVTVTAILGFAASGLINKVGEAVKNRIAPEPEKTEDESN